MRHAIQPVIRDTKGVLRFRANTIVTYLLDINPNLSVEKLRLKGFPIEDLEQLCMLLGYPLTEFCKLEFMSEQTIEQVTPLIEAKVDYL